MKNFKRYIAFTLLFTIIFSNFIEVYAATSTKTYEEKISKEIISVKDDEFVDVIVKLKKEIDSEKIKTEVKKSNPNINKDQLQKQIRKEIVDESVSLAENSQKSILKFLDKNKKEGSVKSYKSFFIVNCVNIVAKKSIVIELAKRPDVEEIIENKKIKIERPEKNFPEAREASLSYSSKHVPWNLKAIGADKAQELTKDSSNEVVVAIIDSGVDSSHPAISKNYRGNDSNLSASSWYNTIDGKNGAEEKPFDDRGHGTHVCGTILGSKEGSLLGVAPKTKWIAVKVFDKNGDTDNTKLLAAGEWILAPTDAKGNKHPELAPRIVNNSWGGNSSDGFYQDMVKKWREAGIFPVFSAGNVSETNNGGDNSIGTPGSYPEAYAVGAIRKDEKVAKFSLRGKSDYTNKWKPDIVAPGVNILSSVPGNRYELYTGTSMASPHVSGVVALMLQANKDLSVEQIEKILNETASPLKDDYYVESPNHGYGYGKVDAYNAVELSMGQTKGKEVNKDKMGNFSGRLLARGEDHEKPSLDHKAISAVYTIYKTSFDANVKDNTGIDSVKLFLNCGEGFKEYEMKLKRGTRLDGYYNVDIPVSTFNGISSGSYYIECSDINGSVTRTEEYSFVVKDGVNIGYVQDFETDISGFEFGGESSLWKWGNIKSDEPDKKLIGTGPYSDNLKKDTIAVMPPIDLSKTDKDAVLSFRHWYDLGNSEYASFDQAEVWIAEVDANSSADNLDWKLKRTYKNSSKGKWVDEFIDLSEYKGKKICLMFGLRANGGWKTKGQGWYIDDIKIEEAVKEIPEKPSQYLSLRSQKNGSYKFSFSPVKNDKITAYELYRSDKLEGPFECVKTVKKGDINGGFGKWTITLSDTPLPQKGSYYYYAVSKIGKNSSEPSKIESITFTKGKEFLSYNFENGKQGWTSVSGSGELAWDFGKLEYGDKYNANFKKPTESQSLGKNPGMNMWATNMDDHRLPKSKYSLISPTMNLSTLSDAKIYYQNWFGSSGKRYSDDYDTYNQDLGEIYISKDDGNSWEKIYTLNEEMLDKKGNRHTWFTDGVEIPKEYLTDKIKIKFLLDTGDDMGASSPEQCGGWYIDDISINTNLNKNTENSLQTENVFENKSPFKLQNMTRASENSSSNNGLIPLVGKIRIKETGVSVTSEAGTGKFSIKHPVGSYTAIAESEGYASKEIPVTITNNSELKEDIYLDKAQETTLNVKVSDEDSNPVNANVKIYKQDDLEVLKEKDGSDISLDKILPGKYNIAVSADGYKTYREEITISESKEIEIKLEKISFQEEKNVGYTKKEPLQLAGQDEKNITFANKISNNKDVQVEEVTYYITKTKDVDLQNSRYRISIYDKNDIDGLPGKILYSKDLNFEKEGWNSLNISNVQVDGDFYIAFTKLSGELAFGIDDKTTDIDSVKMFNNAWIEPQTQGSYMIGAKLREIEDTQKAAIDKATQLVETAETEKTEDAYNEAKGKVEALKESESKRDLQNRLVEIYKYIQAIKAIDELNGKNISDITKAELDNAEALINAVKDEWKKDLSDRLNSLKDKKADDGRRKELENYKTDAKAKVDALDKLNQDEKNAYKASIDGAENKDAIDAILSAAQGENANREEAKKALLQEKEDAKAKIDLLDELSDTEKAEAKKQIDQAENKDAIDQIVKKAEEKNTEAGKNKVDSERLKKAKEELAAYMKSFNEDVVDNPAIEYQDENVKGDIKKAIKKAKDLLAKEEINQEELEEMEKIPFKKVNGKKSGLFRDFTKKALVNFEVLGDKDQINPHNGKKYTALKDNTIKIASSLQGAGKIGDNDKFFFKLNYVKEEDFKPANQATGLDATSTPTPKYKKQEIPKEDYEVKSVEGGYEIKINKLPSGVKIIKPIVLAKLANNTYFENGTLVFVSQNENPVTPGGESPGENPATPGGESPDKPSVDNNSYRRYRPSYPIFFAYSGSEKTKPFKPATETKVPTKIKMDSKLVIGSKKLVVTVNGVQKEALMDVEPFISNNRTMLPIRFVAEALGFEVDWDKANRTVVLKDKDTLVKIPVDTNQIIVNGSVFESDVKPILKNDRTMLPIANIARALGLVDGKDIIWDGTTKEVIIKRDILK
ncbi:S8 family serine peptidase [Peptoniphilus sp.]|uniref:S8 family serine peptidase n=1 Tax=Peptoniphilus sp. TaxID=1971214 RepID=UPI00399123A9